MSYTEMFLVPKSGEFEMFREFPNSWHGAMLLWEHLRKRYLYGIESYKIYADMSPIWKLVDDKQVAREERIALATTFDGVLVPQTHLNLVANAIDHMTKKRNMLGHWGSWPAQAQALREAALDVTCFAVAWNQTSVNSDAWWVPDENSEDVRTYDLARDNGKHWFLFEKYPNLLPNKKG